MGGRISQKTKWQSKQKHRPENYHPKKQQKDALGM